MIKAGPDITNRAISRSFLVQALTGLLCGILCMALLPTSQLPPNKHCDQAQNPLASKKIDFLGIASFTITITSLLASIELWGKGDLKPALILFIVALGFGVIFLLIEAYHAEQPLIPLSLLKTTPAIYFVVQMLLLFGRQAVCLRRSYGPFRRKVADFLISMFLASPRISFGPRTSV